VEIDWSIYPKIHSNPPRPYGGDFIFRVNHQGNATVLAAIARRDAGRATQFMQEEFPDYQGPSVRDEALVNAANASRAGRAAPAFDGSMKGVNIPTPDVKWTGTPEENIRTMRSAARFFGASDIGCVELTANTKKLIYDRDNKGKPYVYKNATVPEVTDSEYVIPNSCKNVLFFSTLEATDQVKQAPAPTWSGYDHYNRVTNRVHYFLGALGYNHVEAAGISTANSFAALSGVGEHSRAGSIATSYKYGNQLRGMHRILTDFPMTPTNPVDAGVAKFCETCKTCATICPYECMDLGEKRWDHWDPEAESLMNYIPGFKGWRTNILVCMFCKNCHTTCPFNAAEEALIHAIVRTTQAITPIFNGFFANMHRTFGYGTRNPDDWWERDVPTGRWDPFFLKA
jgi:reductive dehalogenase